MLTVLWRPDDATQWTLYQKFDSMDACVDELMSPCVEFADRSLIKIERENEHVEEFGVVKEGRVYFVPNVEKFLDRKTKNRFTYTKNWEWQWLCYSGHDRLCIISAGTLPKKKLVKMLYECFRSIEQTADNQETRQRMASIGLWLDGKISDAKIASLHLKAEGLPEDNTVAAEDRCVRHLLAIAKGVHQRPRRAAMVMALGRLYLSQSYERSADEIMLGDEILATMRRVVSVCDLIEHVSIPVDATMKQL